jgi:hypothetical protein
MAWRKEPGYQNLHTLADETGRVEIADVTGMQGEWWYRLRSNIGESVGPFASVQAAKRAAENAVGLAAIRIAAILLRH